MADRKISELPELPSSDVSNNDWIVVTDTSTNTSKKLDFGDYKLTQSETDTTAGRLLTTGAGVAQAYRTGNILGTVSQSGGTPTGALIESGSTANGSYTKFANGTMICTITNFDLTYANAATCQSDWDFPVSFASLPAISGIVHLNATLINATPQLDELMPLSWSNSGDNDNKARLSIRRVAGGTDFQSGDFVRLQSVTAIGEYV